MTDRLLRAVRLALRHLHDLASITEADTSLDPKRFGNRLPQGLSPHSVRAMRDEVLDVAGRCDHPRGLDSVDVEWCPWPECASGISADVIAARQPMEPDSELDRLELEGGLSLILSKPGPVGVVRFRRRELPDGRWTWAQER